MLIAGNSFVHVQDRAGDRGSSRRDRPGFVFSGSGDSPTASSLRWHSAGALWKRADSRRIDRARIRRSSGVGSRSSARSNAQFNRLSKLGPPCFEDVLREHARRLHIDRIVQQDQRLQRRVGIRAVHGAFFARWRVESAQPGMQERALPVRIKRRAGRDRRRGWPSIRAWGNSRPPDSRSGWYGLHAGAAELLHQQARD